MLESGQTGRLSIRMWMTRSETLRMAAQKSRVQPATVDAMSCADVRGVDAHAQLFAHSWVQDPVNTIPLDRHSTGPENVLPIWDRGGHLTRVSWGKRGTRIQLN